MSILLAVIGSFASAPAFTPSNTAYSANATVTIPSGATTLKINCYGAGGWGGNGNNTINRSGGGGGGGGHARKTLTVSSNAGQNFNVVINSTGSYVTSGTYTLTTVQGLIGQNGGDAGASQGVGGAGGTASGGDRNQTGDAGGPGTLSGAGAGGNCDTGDTDPGGFGGAGGFVEACGTGAADGQDGTIPGGGGGGGAGFRFCLGPTAPGNGAQGRVVITFT